MDHPHEPMQAINDWQIWYRNNKVVAEMDEPLVTKDSRENMHDTKNAVYSMPDWRSFYKELAETVVEPTEIDDNIYLQKACEDFGETLLEYQYELNASQFYKAFLVAAINVTISAENEYLKSKELVDILKNNEKTKTA